MKQDKSDHKQLNTTLRRLANRRSWHIAQRDGRYIHLHDANTPGRGMKLPHNLFRHLLSEELIVETGQGEIAISALAKSRLRRLLSGQEEFSRQHQVTKQITKPQADGKSQTYRVNLRESPLGWLYARGHRQNDALVGDIEFRAGERLRNEHEIANLAHRIHSSWPQIDAVTPGKKDKGWRELEPTEKVIAARRNFEKALAAVGPELSGVLLDICCYCKGLEVVEQERQWPRRSAKIILSLGLKRLARHYGYGGQEYSGEENQP